jgi:NADP-dependent 3-hydroxy acid dehydrogenase YdfG
MTDHVEGKVVVVTGAASGFGRLVAQMVAARGAKVVAADIDVEGLGVTAASITAAGGEVAHRRTDVTDRADVVALAAFAVETFGAIDVMVNNAGIMPLAFFADHERAADAWDRCIDINFRGVLNGITAVHDQMMAQGRGQVVNISSIYGNTPVAGSAVYTATKAAVNVLSETLRIESQGKIKVTTVKPTGVPGTNLGSGIVNGDAMVGILGQNAASFGEKAAVAWGPDDTPEKAAMTDPENIAYWAIAPEELAAQVVYVIDQPWGISISDITVRASGDLYLS